MTCWSSGANAGLTYRMAFCLFYSIHALKKRIYDLIVYTMSRNIDRFCALYGCFALLVFVHLPACMHVFLHVLVSILVAFLSSEFLYLRPSVYHGFNARLFIPASCMRAFTHTALDTAPGTRLGRLNFGEHHSEIYFIDR